MEKRAAPAAVKVLAALPLLVAAAGSPADAQNLPIVVTDASDTLHDTGCAFNGAPPCTLRDALTFANARPGKDTINFSIGSGPQTIALKSPLPAITEPVVIDATKQPGWVGAPIVALDGDGAGNEAAGLQITAGSSVVRGLALWGFRSTTLGAVTLTEKGGNRVEGNYIGLDVGGERAPGNRGPGMLVRSSQNTIGGTSKIVRNVISGNQGGGIRLQSPDNVVRGNSIGTDAAGTRPLGNSGDGVSSTGGNRIGGAAPGAGNLVSANSGFGIAAGAGDGVEGNLVGTDAAGTSSLGNGKGGVSGGARIGGTDGTQPRGPCSGACNLISGNRGPGVVAAAAGVVQGNFIGTDVSGVAALANAGAGIFIGNVARVDVGGGSPAARNVISGNGGPGIEIAAQAEDARIRGNSIGTTAGADGELGNQFGILLRDGAHGSAIGSIVVTEGNTIAFNSAAGVAVDATAGVGNKILSNAIYGNGALGIDLGNDGVTPNHGPVDPGAVPPTQDSPVLVRVTPSGVEGVLDGPPGTSFLIQLFTSTACDPSGYGQGQSLIAATTVTTDAEGHASFGASLTAPPDQPVTATATASDGSSNTSEFSQCVLPSVIEP